MRPNPDLDSVFNDSPRGDVDSLKLPPERQRRKQRKAGMSRDVAKRYAFKVLAQLASLDVKERGRVLTIAAKLSKS